MTLGEHLESLVPEAVSHPVTWRDQALCAGRHHMFFPSVLPGRKHKLGYVHEAEAKALCSICPVLGICREWALETGEEIGIWGGLTPADREQVIWHRRRGLTA